MGVFFCHPIPSLLIPKSLTNYCFRDFVVKTLNITSQHAKPYQNAQISFNSPLLTRVNSEILIDSGNAASAASTKDDYLASPEGIVTIKYVWENYLSTPYTMVYIPEFPASYWDVTLKTPNGIVHRPNHGLVHTLRVAKAVSIIAEGYNIFLPSELKISPIAVYRQQFGALFSVIGRLNDTGYQESAEYQKKMGLATSPYDDFDKMDEIGLNNFFKAAPYRLVHHSPEAKEDQERQEKNPKYKEVVNHIYWAAHNIDMMRCTEPKKFAGITRNPHETKSLMDMLNQFAIPMLEYHRKVILATGDRCWGYGARKEYNLSIFGKVSKDYKACLKAIDSVPRPVF